MDANVAVLIEDGYEDQEFWYPKIRLTEAGANVDIVAREAGVYQSEHGYPAEADIGVEEADSSAYDAVVIPGGRECPDTLRTDDDILDFVRSVHNQSNIVAAICHAGWVPASAGILNGHTATCYHSIKDDIKNAGATYLDQEVVVSDNLITARHPGDLPAFSQAILEHLS